MNKNFKDAVDRATAIANGVNSNAAELQQKGFNTSVTKTLSDLAQEMVTEAQKYDQLNEEAAIQRGKCYEVLDRLKTAINDSKAGIKQRYDQPSWARFGLVDKK